MDKFLHSQEDLFAQLGLPNSEKDIAHFISTHTPLPDHIALEKADFWTPSQASFIAECWEEDSDWCEIVDQLDIQLRQQLH